MDAYVFVRQADEETVGRLVGLNEETPGEIRFVAPVAGPHDAFVAIDAPSIRSIQRIVQRRIRDAGARDTDTSIVVRTFPPMPVPRRWIPVLAVESLSRIRVQPGMAEQVLEAVAGLDGTLGVAIVAGDYDILLGMGGDSYDEVSDRLLGQLQQVQGIRGTVTNFMSNENE